MDGFLDKFFPSIKAREAETPTVHNLYCQFNSQTLQLMTSSLFIAGAVCELSGTTGKWKLVLRAAICKESLARVFFDLLAANPALVLQQLSILLLQLQLSTAIALHLT